MMLGTGAWILLMTRNYKEEYKNYQGKPEQKKRRAMRNKVRRLMEKAGKVQKGDGKDVHHKDGNPLNTQFIQNYELASKILADPVEMERKINNGTKHIMEDIEKLSTTVDNLDAGLQLQSTSN